MSYRFTFIVTGNVLPYLLHACIPLFIGLIEFLLAAVSLTAFSAAVCSEALFEESVQGNMLVFSGLSQQEEMFVEAAQFHQVLWK